MNLRRRLTNLLIAIFFGVLSPVLTLLLLPQADTQAAPTAVAGTRATLTVTQIADTGTISVAYLADGDGHEFANNDDVIVIIENTYTDTVTATFVTGGQYGGKDIEDTEVVLSVNEVDVIGPFPVNVYNQITGSDKGKVYINWDSAVTSTVVNSIYLQAYRLR